MWNAKVAIVAIYYTFACTNAWQAIHSVSPASSASAYVRIVLRMFGWSRLTDLNRIDQRKFSGLAVKPNAHNDDGVIKWPRLFNGFRRNLSLHWRPLSPTRDDSIQLLVHSVECMHRRQNTNEDVSDIWVICCYKFIGFIGGRHDIYFISPDLRTDAVRHKNNSF